MGKKLLGGLSEMFKLLFGQFSDKFPDEISSSNPPKPLLKGLNPPSNPFKGPNKPLSYSRTDIEYEIHIRTLNIDQIVG